MTTSPGSSATASRPACRVVPGSSLTLEEATLGAGTGAAGPDGRVRQQFALVFAGPDGLPQGTWQVRHDALGDTALFLVPVGPGRYEAAFA
ncbi:hypothetical protein [Nocardioides convexus]|uniref:DUF6916 family protein n=1 Tax=Nocardioides convexus TaxID=2712224 RepID=UPI0024188498|nr:hypothetical protein [Nocardioides convexus]